VLACAVGIYLPVELTVPIFFGGLIAYLVERYHRITADDESGRERVHRKGTLFAAGLITGEALMGIVIAIPIVIAQTGDILALPGEWQPGSPFAPLLGLALLAGIAALLYRHAVRSES